MPNKEIHPLSEVYSAKLFEHFLNVSQNSAVPREFVGAHAKVNANIRGTTAKSNAQEIAQRLFETDFPIPESADYALVYADTISIFKRWDDATKKSRKYTRNYQAILNRFADQKEDDDLLRHIGRIAEISLLEETIKKWAQSSGETLLAIESQLLQLSDSPFQKSLKAIGRGITGKRKMKQTDLQQIRETVENYFATSQHQARIQLLASE